MPLRSIALLLLVKMCVLVAYARRSHAVLNPSCEQVRDFLPSIYEDLEPWSLSGIDGASVDLAIAQYSVFGGQAGVALMVKDNALYVMHGNISVFRASGPSTYLLIYVRALEALVAKYVVPDVEFVVLQDDYERFDLSASDDRSEAALWTPGGVRIPLLRYCKSHEGTAILVPYIHFYEFHVTRNLISLNLSSTTPWSTRLDVAYASYAPRQRLSVSPSTQRHDSRGQPFKAHLQAHNPRTFLANISTWAPTAELAARFDLRASHAKPMRDWAAHKYVVHLDGNACSSKLEQELPLGSLVFKEMSGYRSFFHRLLRPFVHYVPFWKFRPQELATALGWVDAHPEAAERIASAGARFAETHLNSGALECYWLLMLREYAKLQRFKVGERQYARPEPHVPVAVFLAWVAADPKPEWHGQVLEL
jgi:hypothetical protein